MLQLGSAAVATAAISFLLGANVVADQLRLRASAAVVSIIAGSVAVVALLVLAYAVQKASSKNRESG